MDISMLFYSLAKRMKMKIKDYKESKAALGLNIDW